MKKFKFMLIVVLAMLTALSGCGVQSTIEENPAEEQEVAGADVDAEEDGALGDNPTDDEINNFITAKSDNPDKILLRYASTSADLNGQSYLRGCREFLKIVKEKMGDKVEIQYFMNGTFGGSADAILGGLQNGNFELTDWPLASFAEYTNAFQPMDVPYLVVDSEQARGLYLGEAGEIMRQKCIEDTNIIPLYYGQIGMRQITNSKREIKTPEDMSGIKIRVQNNPLHIAGMKALGAAPSAVAFAELFTALQQKTVDGQENPIETIYNFQFYDVQDYLTISNHLCALGTIAVSKDFYDAMDAELKAAIDEAAVAAEAYVNEDIKISEQELYDKLAEVISVYQPTEEEAVMFQDAAKSAWPEIQEIIGEEYFNSVIEAAGLNS